MSRVNENLVKLYDQASDFYAMSETKAKTINQLFLKIMEKEQVPIEICEKIFKSIRDSKFEELCYEAKEPYLSLFIKLEE